MPAIVVITLIIFQALLVLVHLAVYWALVAAFGIGSYPLAVIFVILAFTFVVSSVLARFFGNRVIKWFATASAYWFGLIHFLLGAAFAFFVTEAILNMFTIYVPPAIVGGIYFGAFFLIHLYGTWKSGRGELVRVDIPLVKVPDFWKKNTIVFISDVHLGGTRGTRFARRITRKIQALQPAAVFIGGDLFDGPKCDPNAMLEPFRSLVASHGTYFVSGNHEYFGDAKAFFGAVNGAGIRILNDEKVTIEGMAFVGIDYKSIHDKEKFAAALRKSVIDRKSENILFAHEPANLDVAAEAGIAAAFFGHTHNGQIFPLGWLAGRMYHGYGYGLKTLGAMYVYTSSGVGTWGPPLRLGTKSEIVQVSFVEME